MRPQNPPSTHSSGGKQSRRLQARAMAPPSAGRAAAAAPQLARVALVAPEAQGQAPPGLEPQPEGGQEESRE